MANNYKDDKLVQKCLLQIEEKLGWGSSNQWHSGVFVELSELIHEETNVLLSTTTLKRVWGKVTYKSAPSISTLNALAKFVGYSNWRDFKTQSKAPAPQKIKKPNQVLNQGKIWGYASIIAVLLISLFSVIGINNVKNKDVDFSKVEFTSRPITEGLPNSVVFDLDLKGLVSEDILIQQFWDETKTIKLKPAQTQATGQYYFPGYFRAKLLVDGDIKKEHDLFIQSVGWMATIDYEPIPKYFDESSIVQNNLVLPEYALAEIASSEKPLISSFHYVNDLGPISGDHFSLKTSFRNIYSDKWSVCSITRMVVLGTKGAMIIPFSIPGCVSEIGLLLNDVFLSGKENDLSAFGTDLSQFKHIEVRVENKNIKVSIEDETIYIGHYNSTMGDIIGIRYRFLGAGEVDFITLSTLEGGQPVINEHFDR